MGAQWKILLQDPPGGFHRPGDTVSGVLRCIVNEPSYVKNLFLVFEGKLTWRMPGYRIKEQIIRPQGLSRSIETVRPGDYDYPFQLTLPLGIPSTYNDYIPFLTPKRRIRYLIKLRIEKGCSIFSCMDKNLQKEIFVIGYINPERLLGQSNEYSLQKNLCNIFSNRDRVIKLTARATKRYVAPGEGVELIFNVKNDSDIVIKCIRTELVRQLIVMSPDDRADELKSKTYHRCTVETCHIESDTEVELRSYLVTLPELYSMQELRSVRIEYDLVVTLRLPVPHFNASLYIPIAIGETRDEPMSTDQFVSSAIGTVNLIF